MEIQVDAQIKPNLRGGLVFFIRPLLIGCPLKTPLGELVYRESANRIAFNLPHLNEYASGR